MFSTIFWQSCNVILFFWLTMFLLNAEQTLSPLIMISKSTRNLRIAFQRLSGTKISTNIFFFSISHQSWQIGKDYIFEDPKQVTWSIFKLSNESRENNYRIWYPWGPSLNSKYGKMKLRKTFWSKNDGTKELVLVESLELENFRRRKKKLVISILKGWDSFHVLHGGF